MGGLSICGMPDVDNGKVEGLVPFFNGNLGAFSPRGGSNIAGANDHHWRHQGSPPWHFFWCSSLLEALVLGANCLGDGGGIHHRRGTGMQGACAAHCLFWCTYPTPTCPGQCCLCWNWGGTPWGMPGQGCLLAPMSEGGGVTPAVTIGVLALAWQMQGWVMRECWP